MLFGFSMKTLVKVEVVLTFVLGLAFLLTTGIVAPVPSMSDFFSVIVVPAVLFWAVLALVLLIAAFVWGGIRIFGHEYKTDLIMLASGSICCLLTALPLCSLAEGGPNVFVYLLMVIFSGVPYAVAMVGMVRITTGLPIGRLPEGWSRLSPARRIAILTLVLYTVAAWVVGGYFFTSLDGPVVSDTN